MNKAVFLDKDGTLINDVPYNVNPTLITIADNSVAGLKQLQANGFKLVVVSNQSGVSLGLFAESALDTVSGKIQNLLKAKGIDVNSFYYCPHHPDGIIAEYAVDCECRKPKPGMILNAAVDLKIDLSKSWMVGDILNDVEAGNRAGIKSILIDNGNETEWLHGPFRKPDHAAKNINEAANLILNQPS